MSGWALQNKINSARQPCVLDSEFLILIESTFRAHYFPCLKGFQESSHPSANLTWPGTLGEESDQAAWELNSYLFP